MGGEASHCHGPECVRYVEREANEPKDLQRGSRRGKGKERDVWSSLRPYNVERGRGVRTKMAGRVRVLHIGPILRRGLSPVTTSDGTEPCNGQGGNKAGQNF